MCIDNEGTLPHCSHTRNTSIIHTHTHLQKMHLLLLHEKYLELLESGRELEALHCLRHELAPMPLHHSDKELQLLTSYMMYSDKDMLRKAAGWPGLGGGAREKLMDKLQGEEVVCTMYPLIDAPSNGLSTLSETVCVLDSTHTPTCTFDTCIRKWSTSILLVL